MKDVHVSIDRVNSFRMEEHGLWPRKEGVREAALGTGWIPGREAAYLSLFFRVRGFTRAALDDLVFRDRALVEVGTVRGQAVLLPRPVAPAAIRCPSPFARDAAEQAIDRGGVPQAGRPHLLSEVRRILEEGALSLPDILERAVAGKGAEARCLGTPGVLPAILTLLRLDGEVFRTRLAPPLDEGPPVFMPTATAFPGQDVKGLPVREALRVLCAFYFRVHGPATRADFGTWCGAGPADVAEAFEAHRSSLVRVRVGDLPFDYWLPRGRLDAILDHDRPGADPVLLTPFSDPWLTCHETRAGRFVRTEDLPRILPGPALPAVLVGGQVVGRWGYRARTGEIDIEWFRAPGAAIEERAERAAAEAGEWMKREMPGLSPVSVPTEAGEFAVYS